MYQASSSHINQFASQDETDMADALCQKDDSIARIRTTGLHTRRRNRRGIAALWVILVTPAFLLLLCFVADIGKIWLARVELENALESAALAGASVWGEAGGGDTDLPRMNAINYAQANTVAEQSLIIATNYGATNTPNQNANSGGNLLFGAATPTGSSWNFNPDLAPSCILSQPYAVRAQGSAVVSSFCNGFLGITIGPYGVSAETTAIYDCTAMQPRIVASP